MYKRQLYSTEHLWAKADADNIWQVGITDYAQDLLGDVVFVDAPKVGTLLSAGKPCGLVESVKTGSDLHALVDGTVVAVNQEVIDRPERINDKPYEAWIFKFKPLEAQLENQLLSSEAYQKHISDL